MGGRKCSYNKLYIVKNKQVVFSLGDESAKEYSKEYVKQEMSVGCHLRLVVRASICEHN